MKPIVYVCATSNKAVAVRVDEHALWMEIDQVTHLRRLPKHAIGIGVFSFERVDQGIRR